MYSNTNDDILDGILKTAFEEYLDRELEKVPSDEVLSEMFPISQKSLKKSYRRLKEIKYRKSLPLLYFQRAAIFILVSVTVCFCALMSIKEVRATIADAALEWLEEYVKIDFSNRQPDDAAKESSNPENTETAADVSSLQIGYIPEGFQLTNIINETEDTRRYKYTNPSGDYLIIGIYSTESFQVSTDIEQSEYEKISINGNDAYLLYNAEERSGTVTFGNSDYTVHISCILDKTEIIKVAENIK